MIIQFVFITHFQYLNYVTGRNPGRSQAYSLHQRDIRLPSQKADNTVIMFASFFQIYILKQINGFFVDLRVKRKKHLRITFNSTIQLKKKINIK